MDILLVLGSVTAAQYSPVRKAMLQRNLRPKVVRVTDLSTDHERYHDAWVDGESKGLVKASELEAHADALTEDLKKRIVSDAFGELSLNDVKAIVHEPLGRYESYETKMGWLIDQLPLNVVHYTVVVGNDGDCWLDGAGYGNLEIR